MNQATATHSGIKKGTLLGRKYRLEREIGRGAMGTVWSAIHETLDQRVAIKIISPEHAGSDELRKRFDTEARAAAKLRSRFVVAVSDNGLTRSGVPFIVMEYLEGESLEDRIARLGCLSLPETARVARHVSRALARAHSSGIIHRDLKPANIFLSKSEDDEDSDDWTAKVLDFGIAKMDDYSDHSTTKTGAVLGTPLFMSPEQVRGASSVDSRADLYSFGMVIYNMLTGTYAFEGQSFGDLLVSICTDPLPRLTLSAPHAPAELDTWFDKACAREPDDRYQTASDLMCGFAEAIGDTPPTSRMSMTDVTGVTGISESRIKLAQSAQTLIASSGSNTGTEQVDTGTSAHTVNTIPTGSRLPAILGAAVFMTGALALVSSLSSENEEVSNAHELTSAAPPQVDKVITKDSLDTSASPATSNQDPPPNSEKANTKASESPETSSETKDSPSPSLAKSPSSKVSPAPTRAVRRKPQTRWKPSSPAPKQPQKPPTPQSESEPDLGF